MTSTTESTEASLEPLAITMWEFSWLERRWPGSGYEDWDQALGELVERGYNAIRIDAFPHLVHNDAEKEYLLLPVWTVEEWGSPAINRVRVMPKLLEFLAKCREYGVRVGLSSWFREDEDDLRMRLDTPETLAAAWLETLRWIDEAGLLDVVFCVDLCNEWTIPTWCPYFENDPPEALGSWHTLKSQNWMSRSIAILRQAHPDMPFTFSFVGDVTEATLTQGDVSTLDFLEPHIWMALYNVAEFYREVGYGFERFDLIGYRRMAELGQATYDKRPEYWRGGLTEQIAYAAEWSRRTQKGLITTECWGVVNYRDWPLLDWGYVKELCALGTEAAVGTGRWLAVATSNFCGPQFVGMWRDIQWHQQLTGTIRSGKIDADLQDSLLARRIAVIGS